MRKPDGLDYAWLTDSEDGEWIYLASNIRYIDAASAKHLAAWLLKAALWLDEQESGKKKRGS